MIVVAIDALFDPEYLARLRTRGDVWVDPDCPYGYEWWLGSPSSPAALPLDQALKLWGERSGAGSPPVSMPPSPSTSVNDEEGG